MIVSYDANFDPAALVLPAVLSGVVRRRPQKSLSALIDTGADITAIPTNVVKQLSLYAVGRIEVEGVHAHVETVDIYTVRLAIAEFPAREIEVVPADMPFVILGRDWLEKYHLLLNRPEKAFVVSDTPLLEIS